MRNAGGEKKEDPRFLLKDVWLGMEKLVCSGVLWIDKGPLESYVCYVHKLFRVHTYSSNDFSKPHHPCANHVLVVVRKDMWVAVEAHDCTAFTRGLHKLD